jgi:hypothetical protein
MHFMRLRTIKLLATFIILTLLFSVYLYASIQYEKVAPLVTNLHHKSLKKLFKNIDKHDKLIEKSLKFDEIQDLIKLRQQYQKIEAELELINKTETIEDEEDDSERDKIDKKKLNRSTLVKFIKLDNYLLKKRKDSLKTVQQIVQNDYKFKYFFKNLIIYTFRKINFLYFVAIVSAQLFGRITILILMNYHYQTILRSLNES